jgi:hypothetical protein
MTKFYILVSAYVLSSQNRPPTRDIFVYNPIPTHAYTDKNILYKSNDVILPTIQFVDHTLLRCMQLSTV